MLDKVLKKLAKIDSDTEKDLLISSDLHADACHQFARSVDLGRTHHLHLLLGALLCESAQSRVTRLPQQTELVDRPLLFRLHALRRLYDVTRQARGLAPHSHQFLSETRLATQTPLTY